MEPAPESLSDLDVKHVIVWRSPAVGEAVISAAGALAKRTGRLVIVLAPDERIESLDVERMREAGWMPVERAATILHRLRAELIDVGAYASAEKVDPLLRELGQ